MVGVCTGKIRYAFDGQSVTLTGGTGGTTRSLPKLGLGLPANLRLSAPMPDFASLNSDPGIFQSSKGEYLSFEVRCILLQNPPDSASRMYPGSSVEQMQFSLGSV